MKSSAKLEGMNARSRALLEELRSLPVEEREAVVAELYEGTASELSDDRDGLDDEERGRLHAALEEGLAQLKNGEAIDGATALAELALHR